LSGTTFKEQFIDTNFSSFGFLKWFFDVERKFESFLVEEKRLKKKTNV
jgi:hypothetical protein